MFGFSFSKNVAGPRLFALWLISTSAMSAAASDVLTRLDALDAALAGSEEAATRSTATLDELRKDLFEAAVKAREAKRKSDTIQQGQLDEQPVDDEVALLRDDITQVGVMLRNLRDRLDAMNEIVRTSREEITRNEEQIASLRKQMTKAPERNASDQAEIKALKSQLDKANRMLAEYSATINQLSADKDKAKTTAVVPSPAKETVPATTWTDPLAAGYEALAAGRIDEAAAAFQAALAADPASDEARLGFASCLYEQGDLIQTRALVDEVLERDGKNARALGLSGLLKFRDGDLRGARKLLERAIKLDETNAYNFNYLGVVLSQMKRHATAIDYVQRAVDLDPEYVSALYNLAVLMATGPEPDLFNARIHYNEAVRLGGARSVALEGLIGGY